MYVAPEYATDKWLSFKYLSRHGERLIKRPCSNLKPEEIFSGFFAL